MANLIITIISIALVAVAALMGAYYGGEAFGNSSVKTYVSSAISQNQQILAATNIYSVDNGNTNAVPMCALVNTNKLSTWPNLIMLGPSPTYGNAKTDSSESACMPDTGGVTRTVAYLKGAPIIKYQFAAAATVKGVTCPNPNNLNSFNGADAANTTAVKIAVGINKQLGNVFQAGTGFSASGLPNLPNNSVLTVTTGTGCQIDGTANSANGTDIILAANGIFSQGCFDWNSIIVCYLKN